MSGQINSAKGVPTLSDQPSKQYSFALILIVSLFFFWGFIHNLDPVLIPHLKKAFLLSDLETALVDFSVFIAYFVMALPAGYFMQRYGYKSGIILGLSFFAVGAFLFIPAADTGAYIYFLGALFIIACGLTLLETAANPYITVLGNADTAIQRLNFAQSFNGLAAFLAPVIGGKLLLSPSENLTTSASAAIKYAHLMSEAAKVKVPYGILGCLIVLVIALFSFTKLPRIKEESIKVEDWGILQLLKSRKLRWAIVAQFFYVGAQVCVLSFFIRYSTATAAISPSQASWYAGGAGLAFMIGRFVGTFFMQFISPKTLLSIYSLLCIFFSVITIFAGGMITVYALIAIAFFMSIMFPTIFSMGISGLGKDTELGSSLIVMSIVGGAFLPLALGYISDLTENIQYGYCVPLACFVVVFSFSRKKFKGNGSGNLTLKS